MCQELGWVLSTLPFNFLVTRRQVIADLGFSPGPSDFQASFHQKVEQLAPHPQIQTWGIGCFSEFQKLLVENSVFAPLYCSPPTLFLKHLTNDVTCDQSCVQIPTPPLRSCVALGKLSNPSGINFWPQLQK